MQKCVVVFLSLYNFHDLSKSFTFLVDINDITLKSQLIVFDHFRFKQIEINIIKFIQVMVIV